jgi:hypothetical protein
MLHSISLVPSGLPVEWFPILIFSCVHDHASFKLEKNQLKQTHMVMSSQNMLIL